MTKQQHQERGRFHWLLQRVTAIAMVPLGIWLVVSLVQLPFSSYQTVQHWLNNSVTAMLLALMMVTTIYHAAVGMQEVFKDYVRKPVLAMMARVTINALAIVLTLIILLSIYRVWNLTL